jgi:hypothetical protein
VNKHALFAEAQAEIAKPEALQRIRPREGRGCRILETTEASGMQESFSAYPLEAAGHETFDEFNADK